MIDKHDLVRALAARDGGVVARDVATGPAITVAPSDSVAEALAKMVSAEVSHLLVEERGFPTGVLSALDIARVAGGR